MTTTHHTTTMLPGQAPATTTALDGLLAGLVPGPLQSWGVLEMVALFPQDGAADRAQFVPPLQSVKIVEVPSYGTLVLRNTATRGTLIAPMHIGFFQEGAQNHATSRVLILEAGETLRASDCFCIQASQGGLLKEAQQRFLVLPLGLRRAALAQRDTEGFSRLWEDIDSYTRRYGIARGGHLERFLRPYFSRLLPLRHALESLPGQVGAAYFIGGALAGVEIAPNAGYWQDLAPILAMYCYGPAAILAEQRRQAPARQPLDLEHLVDLDDLAGRLEAARRQDATARVALLQTLATASWNMTVDADRHGLRILSLEQDGWAGQAVREDAEMVYLSVFRDVLPQTEAAKAATEGEAPADA